MPEHDAVIQQAIRIIGADQPSDYALAPSRHANDYAESAPELSRLLNRSEIGAVAKRYEDLDAQASEAQKLFMTMSGRARVAVFCTAIFGALLLVVGNFSVELGDFRMAAVLFTAIGGVISGNLAAMWIYSVREGGLFEAWKILRARAEETRRRYFELVTTTPAVSEPLLQLEYFRRYHLDVQREFFRRRGGEHAQEAARALRTNSGALATAGIATGVAGVLAASVGPQWATLALVALAAQGVASLTENREASAQNRRNAIRYRQIRGALDDLTGMLDDVRAATAAGDRIALLEFVAAVDDQLAAEHQEWQREIEAAGASIDRLKSQLDEHSERFQTVPGHGGSAVDVEAVVIPRRPGADGTAPRAAFPVSGIMPAVTEMPPSANLPRHTTAADLEDAGSFREDTGREGAARDDDFLR